MKNTVTIKYGTKIDTDINIDKSIGFDTESVLRFGAFLADMQNADTLCLQNVEDDGCQCSVIDMSDLHDSVLDTVIEASYFVDYDEDEELY